MIIHRTYLGTWFPRTSIHLKELFRFLRAQEGLEGLDPKKIRDLQAHLSISAVTLHEESDADYLEAVFPGGEFAMTEEGILTIKNDRPIETHDHEFQQVKNFLMEAYTERFGPAISYLYSRGAPIPRDLTDSKTVLPFITVISHATDADVEHLFASCGEKETSAVTGEILEIHRSPSLTVLRFKNDKPHPEALEAFVRHDIFFREFEFQLEEYLGLHRTHWEKISQIRESQELRYRDFPVMRKRLLEMRRTITYVEARLMQMHDILKERESTLSKEDAVILKKYGLNRFAPLESAQEYTKHLWDMTLQYLDGTITLLHTLYEENTQRELAIIKVTTFVAALTGFFGMNIAFPWDAEWGALQADSYAVAFVIFTGAALFYLLLKIGLLNRRFIIGENEHPLDPIQ